MKNNAMDDGNVDIMDNANRRELCTVISNQLKQNSYKLAQFLRLILNTCYVKSIRRILKLIDLLRKAKPSSYGRLNSLNLKISSVLSNDNTMEISYLLTNVTSTRRDTKNLMSRHCYLFYYLMVNINEYGQLNRNMYIEASREMVRSNVTRKKYLHGYRLFCNIVKSDYFKLTNGFLINLLMFEN